MNVQVLIPFTPFLGVIFLFFALIQALRHKQQGAGTAFLALLAIGVPVAAYILVNDTNVQAALIQFMAINAAIVFIGSIIILLIERGNPTRDMNHSYGMLGIGLAILLALGIFLTPMLAKASNNLSGNGTGATGQSGQGNAQVIQALTQQTGLQVADLNTQLSSGSTTIAQLVSAHSGNLSAVTSAISTALDQMNSSGAQSAAFLSRLGSSSDVATQLVQGQLQSRVQTLLVNLLLNGSTGFGGGGSGTGGTGGTGGNGGSGNGGTGGTGGFGGNGGQGNAQSTQQAGASNSGGFGGFGGNNSSGNGSGNGNGSSGGNGGFGGFGGNGGAQSTQAAPSNGSGGFGGFGGSNSNATQAAPANNSASEQSLAPTNTPDNQSIAQVPTQAPIQAPAATEAATPAAETQVAQVLSQQTGLSVADLTTQLNSGSTTIAQLVSAHNGDATAVSTAITNALDQFAATNTQGSQLLSRLGNSSSDIAGEVIQGTLPGRSQQIVLAVLLTGSLPSFGGGNGGGNRGGSPTQAAPVASLTPATPTPTVMRPTLIVFPTDTPTPVGTEEATAESTAGATGGTSSTGTGACSLVTLYSLNMRDKPSTSNGVVLLSVPINTTLKPTSKTSDGWYSVSYGGHSGWVDGQFTTVKGACSSLPSATATPTGGG